MMASARRRILLALLFATLALGALDGLDRMLHDALWGVVGGGEPSVEFRFIDVEELPANKPLLARTIDFLKGEGAKLIVVDFLFPRRVEGDEVVFDAVQRAGTVIVGFELFDADGRPSPRLPVSALAARDRGYVDIPVDPDGVVRKVWYFRRTAEDCYRSLALSAYLRLRHPLQMESQAARARLLNPDTIDNVVPVAHVDGEGEFPVRIGFDASTAIPLSHLADEEARARFSAGGVFKERVVFLGLIQRVPPADAFRTAGGLPRSRGQPGVFLHAAALQALLTGRAPLRAGARARFWICVLCMLAGLVAGRARLLAAPLVLVVGSIVLQATHQLLLPVATMLGAVGIGWWATARVTTRAPSAPAAGHNAVPAAPAGVQAPAPQPPPGPAAPPAAPGAVADVPTTSGPPALEELVRAATRGRYQDLRALAAGGMGTLYEARDAVLDRPVVLKFLTAELAREAPDLRERFAREAALQARLARAGLPVVLDWQLEGARPFLVMETIEGETLAALVKRRGGLPAGEAIQFAVELARMLAVLHDGGVIHRDLKCSNVMVDRTGRLRLIDMGLAREVDDTNGLTQPGTALGTFGYMPPEQENGAGTGLSADVYAYGAIVSVLLTQRTPIVGRRKGLLDFHGYPPPLCLDLPDAPLELVELVTRCLAPYPAMRPSFGIVHRALVRLGQQRDAADHRGILDLVLDMEDLLGQDDVSGGLPDILSLMDRIPERGSPDAQRWHSLLRRVARRLPALDSAPKERAGRSRVALVGRLRKLAGTWSVRPAEVISKAIAVLPVSYPIALGPGCTEMEIQTPHPAIVTALCQTLMRGLLVKPSSLMAPDLRLELAAGSGAGGPWLTITVVGRDGTTPDPELVEQWRHMVRNAARWLGGELTLTGPGGCRVRLPGGFVRPLRPFAGP